MKLTKKLEAEILKLYNKYWDAYLNGKMRIMSSLMDENIQIIGSAEGEVFKSKKETVKYYKSTADQVAGKAEMRNRNISLVTSGNNVLVTEESDFYVLMDKSWTFYGQARISTLFCKSKNKWKVTQQHGSIPDARTEGGEQLNTDKIKEENLRLKDAIKRRTIELEKKNRELEIETALEKVRAIAMGMKEPADMLEVCKTISLQLESLGVKEIRNVQTAIFYEQRGTYMNYEYYSKHKKTFITETDYTNNKTHKAFAVKMLKGKGEIFITHIKGKKVKEWIAYQKTTNVFIDKYLNTASSLNYYWFSLGPVALGISTYHPLSKEETILFKRFLKVFELAYRRYRDIEKAEAQARESQIEASLERVRSKAMAMYKSDDLTPAVATVFSELDRLSFRTVRCGIGIFNDLSEKVDVWATSSNDKSGSVNLSGNEVLEGHPLLEGIFKAWKLQKDYSYVLEGKDLLDYYRVTSNSNLPVTAPEVTSETTRQYYHCIMFPSGGLFAFRESEFTVEAKNLMRRFADVFQLTFTRHLDLRKAEAQNRIIQAENERKTKELEDARQLQLAMLPKELPKVSNLDIAVYMKTATEVGGDYYDFNIDINGTLTVVLGDATGHGMMSGMMVSIMKSFFISHKSNIELKQLFENANNSIKDMQLGRLMMSFMGVQITSGKVIATNAGMPSLIYFRNKSKKAGEFVSNNLPLGAMKSTKYSLKESSYEPGDALLMMSDGFGELKNENNEQYGYPRIIEEFKSVAQKNSNEIVDHLKNSASEWAKGVEPDDDVTFVVIKAI